jgi:hypothetical protein
MHQRPFKLRSLVASIWAVIIGSIIAGGAALIGLPFADVALMGVLGGLGAAAAIFLLA